MTLIRRAALLALPALLLPAPLRAQALVPGAHAPAAVGFNVVTFGGGFSMGDLSFDPALPITDAHAKLGSVAVGIGRTVNIWGRFANVAFAVPYINGHALGLFQG